MATSSILAWKIPWTKKPGGLQSMGLQRVEHNWATTHAGLLVFYESVRIKIFNLMFSSVQYSSVAQSCPTLCNPTDCSPPGPSVQGILQARILEWVAMPSSRGSSQPRDPTQVSYIAGGFFIIWVTRGALHPFSKSHLIMTYDLIVVLNEVC